MKGVAYGDGRRRAGKVVTLAMPEKMSEEANLWHRQKKETKAFTEREKSWLKQWDGRKIQRTLLVW